MSGAIRKCRAASSGAPGPNSAALTPGVAVKVAALPVVLCSNRTGAPPGLPKVVSESARRSSA